MTPIDISDLRRAATSRSSFVYIAAALADGPSKIGITADLRSRLKGLRLDHGDRFAYWRIVEMPSVTARSVENAAHRMLAHRQVIGEVFDATVAEASAIVDGAIAMVSSPGYTARILPPDPVKNNWRAMTQDRSDRLYDIGRRLYERRIATGAPWGVVMNELGISDADLEGRGGVARATEIVRRYCCAFKMPYPGGRAA